jgi:hypothetical protein
VTCHTIGECLTSLFSHVQFFDIDLLPHHNSSSLPLELPTAYPWCHHRLTARPTHHPLWVSPLPPSPHHNSSTSISYLTMILGRSLWNYFLATILRHRSLTSPWFFVAPSGTAHRLPVVPPPPHSPADPPSTVGLTATPLPSPPLQPSWRILPTVSNLTLSLGGVATVGTNLTPVRGDGAPAAARHRLHGLISASFFIPGAPTSPHH